MKQVKGDIEWWIRKAHSWDHLIRPGRSERGSQADNRQIKGQGKDKCKCPGRQECVGVSAFLLTKDLSTTKLKQASPIFQRKHVILRAGKGLRCWWGHSGAEALTDYTTHCFPGSSRSWERDVHGAKEQGFPNASSPLHQCLPVSETRDASPRGKIGVSGERWQWSQAKGGAQKEGNASWVSQRKKGFLANKLQGCCSWVERGMSYKLIFYSVLVCVFFISEDNKQHVLIPVWKITHKILFHFVTFSGYLWIMYWSFKIFFLKM